jgi:4'-phosphopantetheinyl transferase
VEKRIESDIAFVQSRVYACARVVALKDALMNVSEKCRDADLGEHEIHVWHLPLAGDVFDDQLRVLTNVDIERGKKFVFERDRNRFLRARYCVRDILSAYLSMGPCDVPIYVGEHGKPFIPPEYGIAFNLSHSGDAAVFAIGRTPNDNAIGVDVEAVRRPSDIRGLASSVFSASELEDFNALSDSKMDAAFFTCWTRKEAYLKALGVGLTIEPRSITVGIESGLKRFALQTEHSIIDDKKRFVQVSTLIQDDDLVISLAAIGGWASLKMFDYVQ